MDNTSLAVVDSMEVELDLQKPPEEIAVIVKQAAKLVKVCVTSYPNSDKFPTKKAVTNTVNLWANYFADDDWGVVALAVSKHIATSKWPPSIAEIRELIVEITRPDLVPPDEAWGLVKAWIHSTSEYEDDSRRVFPAIIAETIQACGGKSALWALLRQQYGYSGKAGLDKLTFLQLYEPRYLRERQRAMTPRGLQSGIEAAHSRLGNPEYKKLEAARDYVQESVDRKQQQYEEMRELSFQRLRNSIKDGGDDYGNKD